MLRESAHGQRRRRPSSVIHSDGLRGWRTRQGRGNSPREGGRYSAKAALICLGAAPAAAAGLRWLQASSHRRVRSESSSIRGGET